MFIFIFNQNMNKNKKNRKFNNSSQVNFMIFRINRIYDIYSERE